MPAPSLRRRCAAIVARSLGRALPMLALVAVLATGAGGADPAKTLRVAFPVAETGLDPQAIGDDYSFYLCNAIFDPLYTWDYFARPAKLVPNTADGMPQISDGGRTYRIKVKPGIRFAADPVFGGKPRELTADDYVYSIKRIFDPKVRSYWLYLFENHLTGLAPALADARRTGRFDYDRPIEGLKALDRHTLEIRFDQPDFVFANWLAYIALAAVAREVVEAKRDASNRVMDYPVGTGAYRLESWTRGQRVVLAANPDFRAVTWPAPPGGDEAAAATARGLTGRLLPLVPRVEISIIEESEPRLLTFESGALDFVELPPSLADNVLQDGALRPAYRQRGITLHRQIEPSVSFTFFNMDDPVVGGYSREKLALRRAIAMGYDRDAAIRLLAHGQAVAATQPVPPGLSGHDPALPLRDRYDPATARALLDRFGYLDRDGDGYRELPDGQPLTLVKGSTTSNSGRAADELWKKSMDALGLRLRFVKNKWPELNKMAEAGQLPMWGLGWTSSIPDGDTFYSLHYSRNIGTSNDARLRLPEYDRIYERARTLPDGPERNALYRQLTEIVLVYTPWILGDYPYSNVLVQPWVRGFRQHPLQRHQWMYYDVDRN